MEQEARIEDFLRDLSELTNAYNIVIDGSEDDGIAIYDMLIEARDQLEPSVMAVVEYTDEECAYILGE